MLQHFTSSNMGRVAVWLTLLFALASGAPAETDPACTAGDVSIAEGHNMAQQQRRAGCAMLQKDNAPLKELPSALFASQDSASGRRSLEADVKIFGKEEEIDERIFAQKKHTRTSGLGSNRQSAKQFLTEAEVDEKKMTEVKVDEIGKEKCDKFFRMSQHPWGLGSGINQWIKSSMKAEAMCKRACTNSVRLEKIIDNFALEANCPAECMDQPFDCGPATCHLELTSDDFLSLSMGKEGLSDPCEVRARYTKAFWKPSEEVKSCHSGLLEGAPPEVRAALSDSEYVAIGVRWGDKLIAEAEYFPLTKYVQYAMRAAPKAKYILKTLEIGKVQEMWGIDVCDASCTTCECTGKDWLTCKKECPTGNVTVYVAPPAPTQDEDVAWACDMMLLSGGKGGVWTHSSNIYRFAAYLRYGENPPFLSLSLDKLQGVRPDVNLENSEMRDVARCLPQSLN